MWFRALTSACETQLRLASLEEQTDRPAIFLSSQLSPRLLGSIAIAAYSYMALVPLIQPPIMKLLTTEEERRMVMKQLRYVSRREKDPLSIAGVDSLCCATPLSRTTDRHVHAG
jgi:Na+-transporting methylmalonyl-CoA/oxaloacetate decarboxylase beta subunit